MTKLAENIIGGIMFTYEACGYCECDIGHGGDCVDPSAHVLRIDESEKVVCDRYVPFKEDKSVSMTDEEAWRYVTAQNIQVFPPTQERHYIVKAQADGVCFNADGPTIGIAISNLVERMRRHITYMKDMLPTTRGRG